MRRLAFTYERAYRILFPVKIVLATRNRKKTEEIRRILAGRGISLQNLEDFPACPEVVEDGTTFQENAVKKAQQVAHYSGLPALADDSGLVVDALDGAPGVYSARYAGPDASDRENVDKLLISLQQAVKTKGSNRHAHFECVLSLAHPSGAVRSFSGRVDGYIVETPQGENGFGYDPIFAPHDSTQASTQAPTQTFAEIGAEQKDAMSHRGRALALFSAALHDSDMQNLLSV